MAVYVLLAFDDDDQAHTLVEDMLRTPYADILTPSQENNVHATVRGVWKKPTLFCDPSDGHLKSKGKFSHSFSRGKKYGWWVCAQCGKPREAWARGNAWYTALGTNLLSKEIAPEYRPPGWESPAEWRFDND